jgi:hypothetical protein
MFSTRCYITSNGEAIIDPPREVQPYRLERDNVKLKYIF